MSKDVKEIIDLAMQISEENILRAEGRASAKFKVGIYLVCLMNSKDACSTHQAKKGIVRN